MILPARGVRPRDFVCAVLIGVFAAAAVRAQEGRGLTKAELIRFLSVGTYSESELARIVRQNCLSFRPTERDQADLRSLGAGQEVLAALDSCARGLAVTIAPSRLTLRAGQSQVVEVRASLADRPVQGLDVELLGSARIVGTRIAATTDSGGRAWMRIPAGSRTRTFRLPLGASRELPDPPALVVRVVPGPPVAANLSTERLVLDPALDTTVSIHARVTDSFDNPVPDQRLAIVGRTGPLTEGVTGPEGQVTLSFLASRAPVPGTLVVQVDGRALAAILVEPVGGPRQDGAETAAAQDTFEARSEAAAAGERQPPGAPDAEAAMEGSSETAGETGFPSEPYRLNLSLLGGLTLKEDPALRSARVSFRPLPPFEIWARYDRSLGFDPVPLTRGPDEVDALFAGAALTWGPSGRYTTRFEAGRRDLSGEIHESTFHLEQALRVPISGAIGTLAGGAYLGRWFDRDDWLAYARAELPLGTSLAVEPILFIGETLGTNSNGTGRLPEREVRLLLPLAFRPAAGFLIRPAAAVGAIDGETNSTSGALLEGQLFLQVPLGRDHRLRFFGRHQSAPGTEPFTVVTAGVHLRLR